ncbi:MAG: PTS glucose transporter subunit IIA [Fusobacteria bacterium]|nr:MAG: PTS glucose transporter subunit IIA [Fusobacteriota bacterium]
MGLFDFLKKGKKQEQEENYIEIYSPLNGRVIDLSEVPDEAFAEKMIGDGCAIEPSEGSVFAIADAEIDIFDTNHAVSFDIDDLEMIVHFGIDTVKLDGKGFERLVEPGNVKKGDELVKYDLDFIKENAKSTRTPVIISNMEDVAEIKVVASGEVKAGDLLMKVKLK